MRRFVDLHTHTTASDGCLAPEELIAAADRKKLAAVAVTDHDTIDALARARAAAEGYADLVFVPGIEVSAKSATGTLHILGLGIDEGAPGLVELAGQLRQARDERNPKIVAKLQALGADIDMDDVRAVAAADPSFGRSRIISRVHMAEALRRKGCVRTAKEAFQRYIGDGCPAFVDKERLVPADVIATLREAGGLAALAHPVELEYGNRLQLERILRDLIRAGLNGIEVYHSNHSPAQTRLYLDLARGHDLTVVGGSDFHGPAKPDARLGIPRVPLAAITGEFAERFLRP